MLTFLQSPLNWTLSVVELNVRDWMDFDDDTEDYYEDEMLCTINGCRQTFALSRLI